MSKPFVAIVMGSDSNLPVMQSTLDVLKVLGVSYEDNILSAQILSVADGALAKKLLDERAQNAQAILAKNAELKGKL